MLRFHRNPKTAKNMINIIEPCCAERQLGQLLKEAHGRAVLFQTNGDVTAKLFIKNMMLLSGDRPRTLTIAADEMPQDAMRLVQRYAQLGYIATLRIMVHKTHDFLWHPTPPDCEVQIALLPDNQPVPELMMWRGSSHTVIIQGSMPDTVSPALHLYAGQLCGNQRPALRAATDAFEVLFRFREIEVKAQSDAESQSPEQKTKTGTETQKQPKKSNRKKTKNNEVETTEQVEAAPQAEESTEATA